MLPWVYFLFTIFSHKYLNSLFLENMRYFIIFAQQAECVEPPYIQKIIYFPYLPTPPLGQDMTQGQFLSRV